MDSYTRSVERGALLDPSMLGRLIQQYARSGDTESLWALHQQYPGCRDLAEAIGMVLNRQHGRQAKVSVYEHAGTSFPRLTFPNGSQLTELGKFEIDVDQSLSDMIAAGGYDWVHGAITPENFPLSGERKDEAEIVLVHPNRSGTTEEVETLFKEHGLQHPAGIAELLALGTKHPDLQGEFPVVVGLGSRCVLLDDELVPVLYGLYERELNLIEYRNRSEWFDDDRFAAVRK